MRYKIVEKVSGEVIVMQCKESVRKLYGETVRHIEWERLPTRFLCWEHAMQHVTGLKELDALDKIKREEIIDV